MTIARVILSVHDASQERLTRRPGYKLCSSLSYNTFPEAPEAGDDASRMVRVWFLSENDGCRVM